MNDCPRLGKFFNGCKFSPRYDLSAPNMPDGDVKTTAAAFIAAMEASKKKTYVHDVCETCGKTVFRP